MDDVTLCQLIQQIIESEDRSEQQRRLFNRLLSAIPNLQGIYRENKNYYDDAFNEALSNIAGITRVQNIGGNYNLLSFARTTNLNLPPEQVRENLVKWFNRILKRRLADYAGQEPNEMSLNAPLNDEIDTDFLTQLSDNTLNGLDLLISEETLEENRKIDEKLQETLTKGDLHPDINSYPANYTNCTCRELIIRKELQKQKWRTILDDLVPNAENDPYGTVTAHYHRICKPIISQLPNLNLLEDENL